MDTRDEMAMAYMQAALVSDQLPASFDWKQAAQRAYEFAQMMEEAKAGVFGDHKINAEKPTWQQHADGDDQDAYIKAIKAYRQENKSSLADAKDAVDQYRATKKG